MGRLIEMELLKSLSRPSHIENGKEIKEIFDLFGFFGMNNGGWCLMDWWLLLACEWLVGYGRCSANGSAKESEPSQEEKPINSNQTKQFKENERKTIELERQLIEEWNQWSAFNWLSEVRPQPTGGKWNQSILLLLARGAPSKRRVEWLKGAGRRQLNGMELEEIINNQRLSWILKKIYYNSKLRLISYYNPPFSRYRSLTFNILL